MGEIIIGNKKGNRKGNKKGKEAKEREESPPVEETER